MSHRLHVRGKELLLCEKTPLNLTCQIDKKKLMDNQDKKLEELTPETPKTRKRKILTDPDKLWASCKVCKEPGNLENMIRQGLEVKDSRGVVLYGSFSYVYFCSETCKGV